MEEKDIASFHKTTTLAFVLSIQKAYSYFQEYPLVFTIAHAERYVWNVAH